MSMLISLWRDRKKTPILKHHDLQTMKYLQIHSFFLRQYISKKDDSYLQLVVLRHNFM